MAQASELAVRLEATFRMLGKRIYLPSMRRLRALHPSLDKVSFPLLAVLEEKDGLRPSDLATAVDLDLSTVSRHLTQLEQSGLVTRRPDGEDRRASRISLTDTGRESLQTVLAARADLLEGVLAGWSDDDRTQLLALLNRLLVGVAAPAGQAQASPAPASPTQARPAPRLDVHHPLTPQPDQMETTA